MKSSIFYKKNKDLENEQDNKEYMYTDDYVCYIITKYLYEKNFATEKEIYNNLNSIIGNKIIKYSEFKIYLQNNYFYKKKLFYLNNFQFTCMEKTIQINKKLELFTTNSEQNVLMSISDQLKDDNSEFESILINKLYILSKEKKQNDFNLFKVFWVFTNKAELEMRVKTIFSQIETLFNDLKLDNIITDENNVKIFSLANIIKVKQLKKVEVDKLIAVLFDNIEVYMNLFERFSFNHNLIYEKTINSLYFSFSENELKVFKMRFNYFNERSYSLEEVGKSLNITRERVRQIQEKVYKKLLKGYNLVNIIIYCIYLKIRPTSEKYIVANEFKDYIEKNIMVIKDDFELVDFICRVFMFYMEYGNHKIKYNRKLNIIYNSEEITPEEITEKVNNKYGNIIKPSLLENISSQELFILKQEYKENKNGIYIRNGLSTGDIYFELITKNFIGGFKIGYSDDYNLLKKIYEEEFEVIKDYPSPNTLTAIIIRRDFILIDKGTYKYNELCATIDSELLNRIISYIIDNEPSIFYTSIFEKFSKELIELGIGNKYYLKGVIDRLLPSNFSRKRDYIMASEDKISSTEMIINYIRNFKEEFWLEDLHNKFLGVKDYVYETIFYNEIKNGLIQISPKSFTYINNIEIDESVKEDLLVFINEEFDILNSNTISSRKIYGKLSLTNNKLLEKMKNIKGQFALFSIIRYYYGDKFFYSRPLISKVDNEIKSSYQLIKNYVLSCEKFDYSKIIDYTTKMNIGLLQNYLDFMEDMSDTFVQINIDSMIKKETLPLTEEKLNELKNILCMIFDRYTEINTENFKGFHLFPEIKMKWNKYLLVGIIRSFFENIFEIKITKNRFNETDFVIRRFNHE